MNMRLHKRPTPGTVCFKYIGVYISQRAIQRQSVNVSHHDFSMYSKLQSSWNLDQYWLLWGIDYVTVYLLLQWGTSVVYLLSKPAGLKGSSVKSFIWYFNLTRLYNVCALVIHIPNKVNKCWCLSIMSELVALMLLVRYLLFVCGKWRLELHKYSLTT